MIDKESPDYFTSEAEGLSLRPYKCPAGKLTIGYGHNLEDNGITKATAEFILQEDLSQVDKYLKDYAPFLAKESNVWHEIVRDMVFNLGQKRFNSLKKFGEALDNGDTQAALVEMVDSKWFFQVGYRSKVLLLSGIWHIEPSKLLNEYGSLKRLATKFFPLSYVQWYKSLPIRYREKSRLKELYNEMIS